MKNSVSKTVSFIGMMFALMFVVLSLETMVSVLFTVTPPAILTLPLAIALSIYSDYKKMFLGGTLIGVCSFILSFVVGLIAFSNPLVSVVPRVLMGMLAFVTYRGVKKLTAKSHKTFYRDVLPAAVAAIVGIIFNTVSVVLMLAVFSHVEYGKALGMIFTLNFPLELLGAVVLVPVLTRTLQSIDKKDEARI